MVEITRKSVIESLTTVWGNYVEEYRKLSPAEQQEFMKRQGYARLADLVAHFTAWWELAMKVIAIKQQDSSYFFPDINVDEFNAAAVEGAKELTEEQVLEKFDQTRLSFVECVKNLSDADLENPNIIRQLEIDVFGHLGEHAIKKT